MAVSRPLRIAAAALSLLALGAGSDQASLDVSVDGLRNSRGMLRACLTRDPAHFPDCAGDPAAVSASIPAGERAFRIGPLARGTWALSLFHDENGNGRLDTVLGVPREGFAFSRNPPLTFGPPDFDRASIAIGGAANASAVRMRYLL